MSRSLDMLSVGERGLVNRITADRALKRRFFDMGITPGTEISLKKVAPLGDPMEISIRGYDLSIRKCDARAITLSAEGKK